MTSFKIHNIFHECWVVENPKNLNANPDIIPFNYTFI